MVDVVDAETRSRMMSGIRASNTKPELRIRSALHRAGFRYRLHSKDLPGKPDLVFPKYRVALFVHGCFWHGHQCSLFKWPSTRVEFWHKKITSNQLRDAKVGRLLVARNWRVGVLWECATKGPRRHKLESVTLTLARWIASSRRKNLEIGEKKK